MILAIDVGIGGGSVASNNGLRVELFICFIYTKGAVAKTIIASKITWL